MNKKDLLAKLKQLEGLTPDERAELINLLNTKKKYGLIWEDKPEDVEEQLRTQLPVLREVVEKRILATPSPSTGEEKNHSVQAQQQLFESDEPENSNLKASPKGGGLEGAAPNHILIEGDNLHALTALTFTHEGKIDVIYIDPPYNTGNKSWKYNNDYVEKEDNYKHSKFISFLFKRIKIAKRLLKDNGVICCAIDDYEQHNVRHIFDEIFGEENRLGSITVIHNPGGRQDEKFFPTAHEYMLVYAKNQIYAEIGRLEITDQKLKQFSQIDEHGNYKLRGFRRSGANSRRIERPKLWYPIYLNPDTLELDVIENEWHSVKLEPIDDDGVERVWRWNATTFMEKKDKYIEVKIIKGNYSIQVKERENDNAGEKPKTIWFDPRYSAVNGTTALKNIFSDKTDKIFDFPKSPQLLYDTLKICSLKKDDVILDFFGGSGTTLHSLMTLNNDDGGNRKCILVTNNENNICEEVTYERNKRVIQGYTNAKGVQVAGLANNNLRYFRSEYVGREKTHKNKRELVLAATELLCIKEDIYTELAELNGHKLDKKTIRCFSDKGRYLMVIYDEETIETLLPLISAIDTHHKIKIYIFAPGQYPFTEEFEDVLDKVELCALPDAIYKAYSNVLPKKKAKSVENSDEESTETGENKEPNLFTV